MVAVRSLDFSDLGPAPLGARIALLDEVPLDARQIGLLSAFNLVRVADVTALAELTETQAVAGILSASMSDVAEVASRARARLIVVTPEMPEAVVDAVSRGRDVCWVPDLEAAIAELRRLRMARRSDSARHAFDDVRVAYSANARPGRLRNLSNDGMAFEVAEADLERLLPGSVLEDVRLFRSDGSCVDGARAVVRYVAALRKLGRYVVGCAWKPRAVRIDVGTTSLRDRALVAALVKAGLAAGAVVAPFDDDARDGASEISLVGGRVDVARATITAPTDATMAVHDLVRGRFEYAGRLYRFVTVVVAAAPLTLKIPTVLEETLQRSSARHRLRADETMSAEVRSPLVDTPTTKSLVDLSASGCSFVIDGTRELYPIGLRLSVTLRLPDGPMGCDAEVRTLVRENGGIRCGIELLDLDEPSRLRLANLVMTLRYPDVDDGAGIGCDELFGFLRDTGFLTPAKEESLAPVVDEVRQGFDALYSLPSSLFKAVVAREGDQLTGHVSGVRAYRHTWMAQHLTARPTVHVGHLLNLGAAEYFCQNPDFEYFKIYFHADNRWPARVFGGFARQLRDPLQSELRLYRHLALRTDVSLMPTPHGVDVLEASEGELAAVERYFVQRERGLLIRSDDLTRQSLQLSDLNRRFSELGLYRRRRVLCAMRRNVCLGFAFVELSSPGLNLSEALSAFQIFVTDEGRSSAAEVRRSLAAAVLPIYRHAGRPIARGLIAADEIGEWQRLGFAVSDEVSMCWTYHRTLCARFCDHVERLFAAVERRAHRRQAA